MPLAMTPIPRTRTPATDTMSKEPTMTTEHTSTEVNLTGVELKIGGMTCASCANRIEKKLNKLDGIDASVNYATEKARVTAPQGYDPQLLIAEVEKTGYTAEIPTPKGAEPSDSEESESSEDAEIRVLKQRLVGAAILSVPVIAMAMIPALQFDYWEIGRASCRERV